MSDSAGNSTSSTTDASIDNQVFNAHNMTKRYQNASFNSTVNTVQLNRPVSIPDTGISEHLLLQLLLKHMRLAAVSMVRELADKMALSGGIIQQLLDIAKNQSWVENRQTSATGQMRYSLSALGSTAADQALVNDGYVGVCPVPLAQYAKVCLQQSSRDTVISSEILTKRFAGLMFASELLDSIGPALNSSKPILLYGVPGVGKSYLCRHLNRIFSEDVFIPSALEVNNTIIQVYDPQVHQVTNHGNSDTSALNTEAPSASLAMGFDPRWRLCQRPLIITGGELTAAMLEVSFDPVSRTYKAPLQLKANNGILLLDDLGRQAISPIQLFNRWIIPLEERRDYLSLANGLHFEVPFELILLFSTNLTPKSLVDDAFLRRLGYKIEFQALSQQDYEKLWFITCNEYQLECEPEVFDYLVKHYHQQEQKDFLPCLPRDLLSIVHDQVKFKQLSGQVTKSLVDFSWRHYFV